MNKLYIVQDNNKAIFRVNTKKGMVYMLLDCNPVQEDLRRIVYVDSRKFKKLWSDEPMGFNWKFSRGNHDSWKKIKRLEKIEKYFLNSQNSPVPIVEVVCLIKNNSTYTDLCSGRHRSTWLIDAGAEYFPVQVCVSEAELLYSNAGVVGMDILTPEKIRGVEIAE